MPIPTFDYAPLPFAMPRHTPNTSRLQQIYGDTGDQLSRISLDRGRSQSDALARVASIISTGAGVARENKARKEATAIRASEREAERLERDAERKASQAARDADKEARRIEREEDKAVGALVREEEQIEQAMRRAGGVQPALYKLAQKFPALAAQFKIQDAVPVLMNPEMTAASAAATRQKELDAAAATERGLDNTRADAALDLQRRQEARLASAPQTASAPPLAVEAPVEGSQDIMGQAGLTRNGFLALTNPTMLPRDQKTRNAASAEVAKWAASKGIDTSTFASQFKGLNEVLQSNIERFNTVKNIEGELVGDVGNLKKAAQAAGLNDAKAINAAKLWLKGQLNDAESADYAFALRQLTSDIARYNAASSGRAPLESDMADARAVVQSGIAAGSLDGLQAALDRSVSNMDTVLTGSIDRASQGVWKLFGVADKYRPVGGVKADKPATGTKVGGFTVREKP